MSLLKPKKKAAVRAEPVEARRAVVRAAASRQPPAPKSSPPRARARERRHAPGVEARKSLKWVPRYFVTGTDTGVGKTEVSVALLHGMAKRGLRPFAFKPYESGTMPGDLMADSERLWRAGGAWQAKESVRVHHFDEPLAPGIAARLEGKQPFWAKTLSAFKALGEGPGIVEGAGGLLVPLDESHDVIDLIEALELPVILVARAGLGTINHTTLSIAALQERGLEIAAVVLCRTRAEDDASVLHNRPWLEDRFPKLRFLGPLPFVSSEFERERALAQHVAELLQA
jgi:dethiobiotin synthetase